MGPTNEAQVGGEAGDLVYGALTPLSVPTRCRIEPVSGKLARYPCEVMRTEHAANCAVEQAGATPSDRQRWERWRRLTSRERASRHAATTAERRHAGRPT
jgi:hypothetical protein